MDLLPLLRMVGALGVVLGLLAGALWAVRRWDLKLPGRMGAPGDRRLALVERLPLDTRRSVALIRRDGREHLILLAPEGALVLESGILLDTHDAEAAELRAADQAEAALRAAEQAAAMRERLAGLMNKVGVRAHG